jgi:hypothetical protein
MSEPHHTLLEPGDIALSLLVVFVLVLINAFFVASEFALVAVRRTRIDQMAAEGNSSAVVVAKVSCATSTATLRLHRSVLPSLRCYWVV